MRRRYHNFIWALTGERQELLTENGRVVYRGPSAPEQAGKSVDLGGAYMLPGFIDSHCHILPTGLDLQKLHLGACQTPADVLDAVRGRLPKTAPGKWLHAVHYDQTKFPSGEHLSRHDLDRISTEVPILLRHVNGHASVANSRALQLAGVNESTPDPTGGTFVRDASGLLTGVLLEHAHEKVTSSAPNPTQEEMVDAILLATEKMHELGITCASDMMTGRFDLVQELRAYRLAAERGAKVITRLYLQWATVFGPKGRPWSEIEEAVAGGDGTRIAGIKIFADGAIGSATAAIYGSYTGQEPAGHTISRHAKSASANAPEGQQVSGQLIYSPEKLNQMVRTAHDAGHQVSIHAIGDYAVDLVMDAYEACGEGARRHRIEHAMLLSDEQIGRMAQLGCFCTMQPEFLKRFGHSYLRQLGPERTSMLKRTRSVLDAGIPLSFSSDRPIVAGDPWDGILIASNRHEPFTPKEDIAREEAIRAYTVEGARVNEDTDQGSLEPGELALFQLYEEPPLTSVRPKPTAVLSRTGELARL